MVSFFLLDWGYMNMYSCELINLTQKLVRRENFTQQNDRAFVKRLVWLLSFIEMTQIQTRLIFTDMLLLKTSCILKSKIIFKKCKAYLLINEKI